MAWIEQRGKRFRLAFRYGDEKFTVNLKNTDRKDAEACRVRLEENLRLVERGRLTVPTGAHLGLFLLSDGKVERKVEIVRVPTLAAMFEKYQTTFTGGAGLSPAGGGSCSPTIRPRSSSAATGSWPAGTRRPTRDSEVSARRRGENVE
jgi:hypothetical protein